MSEETLEKVKAQRDAYRAVLEAAGYRDLDGIGNSSLEHCKYLGALARKLTNDVITELRDIKSRK